MDTMRERFTTITSQLLDGQTRLAVVLAEIGADGFTEAARRHPERVVNVGIREQLLVGVGGGLALSGMRPILHTFASFLVERPFEQLKLDLGHQGAEAVLVSANGSYDWPAGGYTHMAPGDVALLDTLEGWTVHVPGHPDEAEVLLREAALGGGRVYLRLSNQTNSVPQKVGSSRDGTPGGFLTLRTGSAGAPVVVAVGPMLDATLAALEDTDATVLYAATVRPFDHRALRRAVEGRASADVVLVEPYLRGTSAARVAEALETVPHRLLALGTAPEELRRYGEWEEHVAAHGLDAAGLRRRITAFRAP